MSSAAFVTGTLRVINVAVAMNAVMKTVECTCTKEWLPISKEMVAFFSFTTYMMFERTKRRKKHVP